MLVSAQAYKEAMDKCCASRYLLGGFKAKQRNTPKSQRREKCTTGKTILSISDSRLSWQHRQLMHVLPESVLILKPSTFDA